jgi:hypothetical protein
MRIRVLIQRNHLFGKTNTQKTVAKVKTLHTEEKPSFVYLCISVLGQRNHSLSPINGFRLVFHFTTAKFYVGIIEKMPNCFFISQLQKKNCKTNAQQQKKRYNCETNLLQY